MTRPAEILRDSKIVNVKYFYIWDNNNWKRSWSNVKGNDWAPSAENSNKTGPSILIPYIVWEKRMTGRIIIIICENISNQIIMKKMIISLFLLLFHIVTKCTTCVNFGTN